MGEMPKLTNQDPWQLQEAFAQQALRNDLLEARVNAYNRKSGSTDTAPTAPISSSPPPSNADPASVPNSGKFTPLITQSARDAGVDVPLFSRLVGAESSGNPNAQSPVGAKGLTQLMDGTAKEMGVSNSFDPAQNLKGGAGYLKKMTDKYNGNTAYATAAYNWGSGNVDKWIAAGADPNKLPSSVRQYVKKVTGGDVHADAEQDQSNQVASSDDVDPVSRLSWLS